MDCISGDALFKLFDKSLKEWSVVHYNGLEQERQLTTHYRDRKRERSEQYREQHEMEEDVYVNQEDEADDPASSDILSPKRRSPSPNSLHSV